MSHQSLTPETGAKLIKILIGFPSFYLIQSHHFFSRITGSLPQHF